MSDSVIERKRKRRYLYIYIYILFTSLVTVGSIYTLISKSPCHRRQSPVHANLRERDGNREWGERKEDENELFLVAKNI